MPSFFMSNPVWSDAVPHPLKIQQKSAVSDSVVSVMALTSVLGNGITYQPDSNDGFRMTRYMIALPLCAALAAFAPAAVFAQTEAPETTQETAPATTPEATAETTPPAATSTESLLSLGEDLNQVGQPYTRDVNEAWEMRCIRGEEGADEPCQMYQMMDDGQGAPVAEVSMFRLPEGGQAVAGATVIVPLETSLTSQLTVSIDGDKTRRYPFAFCNQIGCYVRLGLTADDIAAFKRGNEATLTIVPAMAPDQEVALTLSLKGFTASYDSVTVLDQ